MVEEWIEEFLYRGRPPSGSGSALAPAWHVVIGQQVDSPFGNEEKSRRLVGPLTLDQSETLGWPLDGIIAGINGEAVKRVNELEISLAHKDAEIAALKEELAQALISQA